MDSRYREYRRTVQSAEHVGDCPELLRLLEEWLIRCKHNNDDDEDVIQKIYIIQVRRVS